MNEQETITDIIKKIRAEANSIEESARGSLKVGEDLNGMPFTESDLESALDLAETKRKEADRLEAALKREKATAEKSSAVGDAAKLREALEKCANWGEQIDCQLGSSDETVYAFRDERCLAHNISECARAALALPPRNCDVGSVTDQRKRYAKMCQYNCDRCALQEDRSLKGGCEFSWAQLAYESEVTK